MAEVFQENDIPKDIPKFITGKTNWFGAPIEKRRAEWRYLENGKYDNRPIDKDYFKKYMIVKVECPLCGKFIQRGDLSKHKKRTICAKNRKEQIS